MNIIEQINSLKQELHLLINTYTDKLEKLQNKLRKLNEESINFENNWMGEWASHTFNYYYDFISSSGNTLALDQEQIQKYIESESNTTINELEKEIQKILKIHKDFQEKLVTELSVIKGMESLEPEIDLLEKIESHKWGMSSLDYVKMKKPRNIFTHNPASILNKGLDIPPHLNISGILFSLFSSLTATEDFQKNSKRLLRQIELKLSIEAPNSDKSEFIIKIINSFHTVARQLRNRYSNRETLTISDEYDVQDLLHALLRIEFDDIRPEEYTPSYAGSATRMDFLLKKERTVIEVKKTRDGLKDKEVGDQLILDAQHYKSHPNCKRLICFVYDPENRIENPRGLETDLNTLSTEELIVEVFIRP